MRIAHLARERRDVVPTVISPQSAEHRRAKAGHAATRRRVHIITSAADISEREMRPIAAREYDSADADRKHERDLEKRQSRCNVTAQSDRAAVDQSRDGEQRERDDLQMTEGEIMAEQVPMKICAAERAARQDV